MNDTDNTTSSSEAPKAGFDFKQFLQIKFEDSPAFGQGKMDAETDKTFCMLAHPFSWIIWLWKKSESPAVAAHGKETTNFFLSYLCYMVPLSIVTNLMVFSMPALFFVLSPILMLIGLAAFALFIVGLLKAKDGKLMRYPLNFRFIK